MASVFMGLSGFFVDAAPLLAQRFLAGLASALVFVCGGLLAAQLAARQPARAGLLIGLSKFYDALVDPLVGAASDRTRGRWGRRRPYLLWGGLLSAVSFALIFQLDAVDPSLKVAAALVVLLLNASGYALFNVPYLAMPGEMTDDYHERTRLMSFRVAAVAAGQLLAASVGPLLILAFGGGAPGHQRTAWLLAAIIAIASVASFLSTRDAPAKLVPHAAFGLGAQGRAAFSNQPFMLLLGVKLTYLLGLSIFMAVLPYLFTWVMKVSYQYLSLYFLLQASLMLLSQPLWVAVTRRIGKKRAYVVGSLVTSLSLTGVACGPKSARQAALASPDPHRPQPAAAGTTDEGGAKPPRDIASVCAEASPIAAVAPQSRSATSPWLGSGDAAAALLGFADHRYGMADLQALEKKQQYLELLQHVEDVAHGRVEPAARARGHRRARLAVGRDRRLPRVRGHGHGRVLAAALHRAGAVEGLHGRAWPRRHGDVRPLLRDVVLG
jgi:MFS family permease